MSQADWLRQAEPVHAIHMEHLNEGLSLLGFWRPEIEVPQLNTTAEKIEAQSRKEGRQIERPPWRELYEDREARQAVIQWAANDFKRFGYPVSLGGSP